MPSSPLKLKRWRPRWLFGVLSIAVTLVCGYLAYVRWLPTHTEYILPLRTTNLTEESAVIYAREALSMSGLEGSLWEPRKPYGRPDVYVVRADAADSHGWMILTHGDESRIVVLTVSEDHVLAKVLDY